MTSENDSPKIVCYVLNSGIGESIIINLLPIDKWGVVDCYSNSKNPRYNPTLNLLDKQKVTELEFLCWTHPHHDHYKGLSHVLKHYENKIKRIWMFPSNAIEELVYMAMQLKQEKLEKLARLKREAKLKKRADELKDKIEESKELIRIINKINRLLENNINFNSLFSIQCLYNQPIENSISKNIDIRIYCLGPCAKIVRQYNGKIKNYVYINTDNLLEETICIDDDKPPPGANMICGALFIQFGETKILLGADVEKDNWEEILKENKSNVDLDLSSDLVKISHHGSINGICNGLWESLSYNKAPIGVVTPYRSQGLPQKEAIEIIQNYARLLKTTSIEALPFKDYIDLQGQYQLVSWFST